MAVRTYTPIEFMSGGARLQIWGLSEGSIKRLSDLAKRMDSNMSPDEYCKNVLRMHAYKNLKECEGCTLRDKLEKLRPKFDKSISLSAFCRGIILEHLKENS